MADNHDTIVKIRTEADNSGSKSAQKELDKVGDSAEKAGKRATAALDNADSSAKKATGAFGRLGAAVKGFTKALGYIGLAMRTIEMLVGAFNKVRDWLDRDKKAAEELARQIQDSKNQAAIEASAAAYEKLNVKVAETLRLEKERDRLADQKLGQQRAAEDAQSELEMQQELAGLDRNDPDYAEKAELVRSKYARIRSKRSAERARTDRITSQQRLIDQADEKEAQAAEMEKDVEGKSGDAVISLKRQIAAEKDPERKKGLEQLLDQLLAQQQKKLEAIKKLRAEADSLRKEAVNLFGAEKAAQISAKATNVAQDAADADTRRRIGARREEEKRKAEEAAAKAAAKAAQVAADKKTVSDAGSEILGLQAQGEAEQARAQAAADAYAKEKGDVIAAQNSYDMLVANGGSRKEKSAALAALQKEKAEAEEAQHEMEKVAAEVASTLQGINAQIKALASAVQKAENRLAQNQADAPEG